MGVLSSKCLALSKEGLILIIDCIILSIEHFILGRKYQLHRNEFLVLNSERLILSSMCLVLSIECLVLIAKYFGTLISPLQVKETYWNAQYFVLYSDYLTRDTPVVMFNNCGVMSILYILIGIEFSISIYMYPILNTKHKYV